MFGPVTARRDCEGPASWPRGLLWRASRGRADRGRRKTAGHRMAPRGQEFEQRLSAKFSAYAAGRCDRVPVRCSGRTQRSAGRSIAVHDSWARAAARGRPRITPADERPGGDRRGRADGRRGGRSLLALVRAPNRARRKIASARPATRSRPARTWLGSAGVRRTPSPASGAPCGRPRRHAASADRTRHRLRRGRRRRAPIGGPEPPLSLRRVEHPPASHGSTEGPARSTTRSADPPSLDPSGGTFGPDHTGSGRSGKRTTADRRTVRRIGLRRRRVFEPRNDGR